MIWRNRWIRRVTLTLIILLAGMIFFVSTEPGLKLSVMLVKKAFPNQIKADTVRGRLFGKFTVTGLELKTSLLHIKAKNLTVSWRPFYLLRGEVYIKNLQGSGATIEFDEPFVDDVVESSVSLRLFVKQANFEKILVHVFEQDPIYIESVKLQAKNTRAAYLITRFNVKTPTFIVSARGTSGWDAPHPVNISYEITSNTTATELQANGKLSGSLLQPQLSSSISKPFKLKVNANLDFMSKEPKFDLQGEWQKAYWPLTRNPTYFSNKASLTLKGTTSNYKLNLTGDFQVPNLPRSDLNLSGQGTTDDVNLKLDMNWLNGKISAESKVGMQAHHPWQIGVNVKNINPSFYLQGSDGEVNFNLNAQGSYDKQLAVEKVVLDEISGQINHQPLDGNVQFQQQRKQFKFKPSFLTLGKNKISVSGGREKNWQFHLAADMPTLSDINSNLQGKVNLSTSLTGSAQQAVLHAKVDAQQIKYEKLFLDALNFTITGNAKKHPIQLSISNRDQRVDVEAIGQYTQDGWQALIKKWHFQGKQADDWELKKYSSIRYAQSKWNIDPMCWQSGKQSICLELLHKSSTDGHAKLNFKHVNTKNFNFLLPRGFELASRLDLNAELILDNRVLKSSGKLKLAPGKLAYTVGKIPQLLAFENGELSYELDHQGLYGKLLFNIQKNKSLNAEFNLPDYSPDAQLQPQQKVQAHISFNTNELDWLEVLVPEISESTGAANLNLNIDGTTAAPALTGQLSVENAQTTLPYLGLVLKNIQLKARADGSNKINLHATADSNEGSLIIDGNAQYKQMKIFSNFNITGDKFLIFNTPQYEIYISPDLQVATENHAVHVKGKIIIPKATISPKDFSNTLTLPSNDVRFIGTSTQEDSSPWKVNSNITLKTGNDINLTYMGLEGKVRGQLEVQSDPSKPAIANGQLNIVDGKYRAYNQELTIDSGMLFYANNQLDNPGVNLRASRTVTVSSESLNARPGMESSFVIPSPTTLSGNIQVAQVKVGVQVTGTIDKPKLSLFSQPGNIPQSDILSYLVLGRPLGRTLQDSSTRAEDSAVLFDALSTLNLGGTHTSQITRQIEHTFGLDKFQITNTTTPDPESGLPVENTALVVGKAVTSRLYIDYTIGLLQTLNILRINYKLSNNWSIQSQNSETANSLDILYTINKK